VTAAREARGGTLVIGGGFAGGYVARLLGDRSATIVSPENFMLYTPMLPEAASGVLGLRFRGFAGWFIARSSHRYQLPLVTRKLRVVADWTTSLFFRRDIAELGELGKPSRLDP
jgi:NADH dehydrogenase FAD-containing subunit